MDEEKLKELGAKLAQTEKDREEFKGMCQKMSDTVKKLTGKTFDEWAAEESAEHDDGAEAAKVEEAKALRALKDTVVAITGQTDVSKALGAVTAMAAQAKEFVALKAKLDAEKATSSATAFDTTLDAGIKDGKIPPAMKGHFVSLKTALGTEKGLEMLRSHLDATQEPIVQLRAPTQPTPGEAVDPLALVIAGNSAGAFGGVSQFKKMHEPKPLA